MAETPNCDLLQIAFNSQVLLLNTGLLLFGAFVLQQVLSIGAPVRYADFSTEFKTGVVLKHFPDKYQTLLVDRKTRRRKTVSAAFRM